MTLYICWNGLDLLLGVWRYLLMILFKLASRDLNKPTNIDWPNWSYIPFPPLAKQCCQSTNQETHTLVQLMANKACPRLSNMSPIFSMSYRALLLPSNIHILPPKYLKYLPKFKGDDNVSAQEHMTMLSLGVALPCFFPIFSFCNYWHFIFVEMVSTCYLVFEDTY